MSELSLEGKQIVITGGTGALGTAVVGTLLQAGARCHVPYHDQEECRRFPHAEQVHLHEVDCTNEADVAALYAELDTLWASVHLAGGFAMAPIEQTEAKAARRMFELNAMTAMLCCREAINAFRRDAAAADAPGGRIVNVSARPAVSPAANLTAYAMSKAAVAALTQTLAEEVKDARILVNAVLPSLMDTPANRRAMPNADFDAWPKVEQVAAAIHWLISPANTITSGALLPVYGRA